MTGLTIKQRGYIYYFVANRVSNVVRTAFASALPLLNFMTRPTILLTTFKCPFRMACDSSGISAIICLHHVLNEVLSDSETSSDICSASLVGDSDELCAKTCLRRLRPEVPVAPIMKIRPGSVSEK